MKQVLFIINTQCFTGYSRSSVENVVKNYNVILYLKKCNAVTLSDVTFSSF